MMSNNLSFHVFYARSALEGESKYAPTTNGNLYERRTAPSLRPIAFTAQQSPWLSSLLRDASRAQSIETHHPSESLINSAAREPFPGRPTTPFDTKLRGERTSDPKPRPSVAQAASP